MARPVIVSADAATGIEAESGRHFVVAPKDAAFVEDLLRLSKDVDTARALGCQARQFVLDTMSWPAMLSDLPLLLGLDQVAPRNAA